MVPSLKLVVVFLSLLAGHYTNAITRREFLGSSAAVAIRSVLPQSPGWLGRLDPETAPALMDVVKNLTRVFPASLEGVPGQDEILSGFHEMMAGWRNNPKHFRMYSSTVTDRIMASRFSNGVRRVGGPAYETFLQTGFDLIEKELAREFDLSSVRVRAAMRILVSSELLIHPAPNLIPLSGDIPLTDAFVESFLAKLAKFHPDMALWNLSRLSGEAVLTEDFGLASVIALDYDLIAKKFVDRPDNLLKFEFYNGYPLDNFAIWPKSANEAWTQLERSYLNAIWRVEHIPAHLAQLPPSRIVERILNQTRETASALRSEITSFHERYLATRLHGISSAGRIVNLGVPNISEAMAEEAAVVTENVLPIPKTPAAEACETAMSTSAPEVLRLDKPAEDSSHEHDRINRQIADLRVEGLTHAQRQSVIKGE